MQTTRPRPARRLLALADATTGGPSAGSACSRSVTSCSVVDGSGGRVVLAEDGLIYLLTALPPSTTNRIAC